MLAQFLVRERRQPGIAQQCHVQRLHDACALDDRVHGCAAADRCGVRVRAYHRHRPAIDRLGVWPIEGGREWRHACHEPDAGII